MPRASGAAATHVVGPQRPRQPRRPQRPPQPQPPSRPRRRRHIVAAGVVAAYLLTAIVVAVAHNVIPIAPWLALHLLLLGAATNAVFVWSRHFALPLLHARQGSHAATRARLLTLNVGILCVLVGAAGKWAALTVTGAALVIGAVIAHTVSLLALARAARLLTHLPTRFGVIVRFYVAAGVALALGAGLGAVLAGHAAHSRAWEHAVELAHVHLNLFGWLGFSVIGTQFLLWPAVLHTRMTDDTPTVAHRVLIGACSGLGIAVAAISLSPDINSMHWFAALGMALYAAAVAYALEPTVREMRAKRPRSSAAWAFVAGNSWLVVALVLDVAALASGVTEAKTLLGHVLVPMLGAGVVAQILTGALGYLLPVAVGGGPSGNRVLTAILDYHWRIRALVGNAGVLVLVVTRGTVWHEVGWACVLAGFGASPLLVLRALTAAAKSTKTR